MNLKSWVESERGRAMALSKIIGVPPSFVSKMVSGDKAIPAEHCKAIEAFTGGEVTCQEMRPADWYKYWPELAPTPATPAQAATETVAIEAVVEEAKAALEDVAETMKVEIKQLAEEVRASLERPIPPWDGITERRHTDAPADTYSNGRGI